MAEKVTIYTLAKKLNVSTSMISRAFKPESRLNPEKRKLILQTAEEMGFVQNKMASRLSGKAIRIAAVIYARFKPYYEEMIRGIQSACQTLSDYKVTCDIHVLPVANHTPDDVYAVMDQICQDGYDGMIVHGLYGEKTAQKIDALLDKGVRVVTLHNDILSCRRLFTSISNIELTGNIAVELLDIFLPADKRKVVMFSGDMRSLVHQTLTFSFIRHAEESGLQLLRQYATQDFPDLAAQMVAEAFRDFDEIDGIYISSANSIPICRYVHDNGLSGKVVIIASDVFPELSEYIRNGTVNATIYQNPFEQGRCAFEGLYYFIAEGKQINSIVMVDPQIVLKSNLSVYMRPSAE